MDGGQLLSSYETILQFFLIALEQNFARTRGGQRTISVYHIHQVEIFPKSDIRQDYKYIALGFGLFDLDLCAHLNSLVT